ncbi:Proclotting enzyme [Eumeta japonica]|uniref:Proclotting enzyme n=1 Tax=Eumeta variegata TaxID=151549 RepID=A0A4C1TAX9_EUMVA|nr:Proclotting enzyme [Eumeta japonica]
MLTSAGLPGHARGQFAPRPPPPPDRFVGFLQRTSAGPASFPPPAPLLRRTALWHEAPSQPFGAALRHRRYPSESPIATDPRLLSEDAFSRISETLGAINTVGHYLVDVVNDNDRDEADPTRRRLPGALYTLSKTVLGPNVTDAIAPLVRRALPNVLPEAPIDKIATTELLAAPPDASACTTPEGHRGFCDDLKNCPQLLLNLVSLRESLCFKKHLVPGVCCPTELAAGAVNAALGPPTHLAPVPPRPPAAAPPSSVLVLTTAKPRPHTAVTKPRPHTTTTSTTTATSTTVTATTSTTVLPPTTGRPLSTAFLTVPPPIIANFSNIVDISECGQREDEGGRIVGGTEARAGAWPWMAAIYLHGSARREFWCGGSLVSARHVLTAAHCTRDSKQRPFPARQFSVRLGDVDLARDDEPSRPVTVRVTAVRAHDRFSRAGFYNDIAVLVLAESVQKSKYVIPICLPEGALARELWEGALATVVGWGTTRYGGSESSAQLEARLPVWRNDDCDRAYFQPITESFLCAGYARGGTDACQSVIVQTDGRERPYVPVVKGGLLYTPPLTQENVLVPGLGKPNPIKCSLMRTRAQASAVASLKANSCVHLVAVSSTNRIQCSSWFVSDR